MLRLAMLSQAGASPACLKAACLASPRIALHAYRYKLMRFVHALRAGRPPLEAPARNGGALPHPEHRTRRRIAQGDVVGV